MQPADADEDENPPVPPRHPQPLTRSLRFIRRKNQILHRLHQFKTIHFSYLTRLKIYALIALILDFFTTLISLSLTQHIHLTKEEMAEKWQRILPVPLLALVYIMPFVGVLWKLHAPLLLYVILTLLYIGFAFAFTIRAAFNIHRSYYFFFSHYCSSQFTASDSLLCTTALVKLILYAPIHRYYLHLRDLVEYRYFLESERDNVYGQVDIGGGESPADDLTPMSNRTETVEMLVTPSEIIVDSLAEHVYQNTVVGPNG